MPDYTAADKKVVLAAVSGVHVDRRNAGIEIAHLGSQAEHTKQSDIKACPELHYAGCTAGRPRILAVELQH